MTTAEPSDRGYTGLYRPKVIILVYVFGDGSTMELHKEYTLSPKNRLCFKWGPGLFNGMRRANYGQFHFHAIDCEGGMAQMVTNIADYHKDKAHFLKCVIRAQRRIHKRAMNKFVGGSYK